MTLMYSPSGSLLSLAWLAAAHFMLLPHVDGAAYFNSVSCLNYTFPDTETIREFCFQEGGTTPSPAALVNGTTFYLGGYTSDFYFESRNESNSTFGTLTGLHINVAWEDDGGLPCQVLINDQNCSSCTMCSSNATAPPGSFFSQVFSADCSNFDQGRNVTCEPIRPLFFPLLYNYSDLVGPPSISDAPMVMTPTFAPTIASTFKPTIPTPILCPPDSSPTEAPESVAAPPSAPMTSAPVRSPVVPASKPEPTSASASVVLMYNSFVTSLLLLVVGGCIY
jgi:hypothetical protein